MQKILPPSVCGEMFPKPAQRTRNISPRHGKTNDPAFRCIATGVLFVDRISMPLQSTNMKALCLFSATVATW